MGQHSGPHLERTRLGALQSLGVFGEPIHNNADHIRDTLQTRLTKAHAMLLAIPKRGEGNGITDWYAALDGPLHRWNDLDRDEKQAFALRIEGLARDIASCAKGLQESGSRGAQMMAQSIETAGYLASTEHIFIVGDQPVITCWGLAVAADPDRLSVLPILSQFVDAPLVEPPLPAEPSSEPAPPAVIPLVAPRWRSRVGILSLLSLFLLLLLLTLAVAFWRGWLQYSDLQLPDINFGGLGPQETLHIPPDVLESGDLSFLEGRWRSVTELFSTSTGEPVVIEYALDASGRGASWLVEPNQRCEAKVEVHIDKQRLVFQQTQGPICPNGTSYVPSIVTCEAREDGTAYCVADQENMGNVNVEMIRQ